jgi:hypothetical protein
VGIKDDEAHRKRIMMMRNVDFTQEKLPNIVALLDQGDRNGTPKDRQLKLLVQEQDGLTSTPQRITAAIESINLLYRALCRLHNESEDTLALVKCDSGSDKSFDFTRLPQIIEQVKTTVFGIVDRVIFFRERKYSERVKCVAESLPILAQISEMVELKNFLQNKQSFSKEI